MSHPPWTQDNHKSSHHKGVAKEMVRIEFGNFTSQVACEGLDSVLCSPIQLRFVVDLEGADLGRVLSDRRLDKDIFLGIVEEEEVRCNRLLRRSDHLQNSGETEKSLLQEAGIMEQGI